MVLFILSHDLSFSMKISFVQMASLEARGEHPLVLSPKNFQMHAKSTVIERYVLRPFLSFLFLENEHCAFFIKTSSHTNHCSLRDSGKVYIVPAEPDNDLFCVLATLVDQKTSCSKHMNPGAKIHTTLITNNLFLDQRRKMVYPALFRQWFKRHCYRYCSLSGRVNLPTANRQIRRIECNDWPRNNDTGHHQKASDPANGKNKVWHFPVQDWPSHQRFVVRLPPEVHHSTTSS